MAETMSHPEVKKNLDYDEKVIKKITGIATESVPGVIALSGGFIGNLTDRFRTEDKTKGIDAEVGKKQVALDLNVICEYGRNVPQLFDMVVDKVSAAVKDITGLDVVELNMHVEDVLAAKEFSDMQKSQKSQQANMPASAPAQDQGARVQ